MSKIDEQLSALLDGECSAQELDALLETFEQVDSTADDFSRLVASRDALAGTRVDLAPAGFAAGVMAAIAAEDSSQATPAEDRKVTPLFAAPPRRRWQPAAGLALAASVAAVAFLGLRPVDDAPLLPAPVSVASSPAAVAPLSPAGDSQRAALSTGSSALQPALARTSRQREGNARLASYMIDYSNARSAQGFGGALGYARVAAHAGNGAVVQTADERR